MSDPNRSGLTVAALGALSLVCAATAPVFAATPQAVAQGVWLIPGGMLPNREPDGNTVILEAPAGLIVVDTGRHRWHRDAILAFADARAEKIVAIVNTHWHLDHVSGNRALRAAFPALRVYASDAIERALPGFLASSAKDSAAYLDDPNVSESLRDDIRADLTTIQDGAALKPDVIVAASREFSLGGRQLQINLAPNAATAGDLWLYDATSRVAVLGDLVTLPAPFLDTACPDGWQAALARVEATPFRIAIPGHGAPMTRAQLSLYRTAFEALIGCSDSVSPEGECAARWATSIRSLIAPDAQATQQAKGIATYYVGMLRANGGRSKYCEAPPSAG